MDNKSSAIAHAVVEFVEGTRIWGLGRLRYDNKLCDKGIKRACRAELKIRDLTGSVDILLPLLQHENLAVRHGAAVSLLCHHRDEAVAALKIVDETAELEISFAAGFCLEIMGEANRGTGPDGPRPYIERIPTSAERYAILQEHLRDLEAEA